MECDTWEKETEKRDRETQKERQKDRQKGGLEEGKCIYVLIVNSKYGLGFQYNELLGCSKWQQYDLTILLVFALVIA